MRGARRRFLSSNVTPSRQRQRQNNFHFSAAAAAELYSGLFDGLMVAPAGDDQMNRLLNIPSISVGKCCKTSHFGGLTGCSRSQDDLRDDH